MNYCPCCSASLLRHIRLSGIYWFCPRCYQEMPNLAALIHDRELNCAFQIALAQELLSGLVCEWSSNVATKMAAA